MHRVDKIRFILLLSGYGQSANSMMKTAMIFIPC
ncbi:hypothetical protein B0G52_11332 [Cohnella sp. SGD-V74]|nr:hypothetical protein B0G52_11332 [Cohnella sp. SGD-V74]